MKNIDFLEFGGGHLHVRHGGELIALPDPRAENFQWVLMALSLGFVPGTPNIPVWQTRVVFDRWRAAWDLPEFSDARRLAYLVDHYRGAISSDLRTYAGGLDLGELWRARRWTLLLDLLDRLPSHSQYAASVSMDENHARLLAEAMAAQEDQGESQKTGPALTTWTPEMATLTKILDAVRHVSYAVVASQHGKKAGEPPTPSPVPVTPLERAMRAADFAKRKASHESLVARVLPNKGKSKPPVD